MSTVRTAEISADILQITSKIKISKCPPKSDFPDDILKFMKKNATEKQALKLMKANKYFIRENCPFIYFGDNVSLTQNFVEQALKHSAHAGALCLMNYGIEELPNNLGINGTLYIRKENFLSHFISKCVTCDLKSLIFDYLISLKPLWTKPDILQKPFAGFNYFGKMNDNSEKESVAKLAKYVSISPNFSNTSSTLSSHAAYEISVQGGTELADKSNPKKVQSRNEQEAYNNVQKYGGAWNNITSMNTALEAFEKESEKRKALVANLRYHKFCLKKEPLSSKLYTITANGKPKDIDELIDNLKYLIRNEERSNNEREE